MKNFFKYDGRYYRLMNKTGNILLISFLFIVTSLPLITIIPSLSALYYATVKTIRTENGYPSKEYLRAFRREWKPGVFMSILFLIVGIILYIDLRYVAQSSSLFGAISFAVLNLIAFIWFSLLIYMPVVWSRFKIPLFDLFKQSLFMIFRHLPSTILFVISYLAACVAVFLIPIPLLFLIPSLLMLGMSYIMENIFKKYMKEAALDSDKWYINI